MADRLQRDLDALLREEPYVRALARALAAGEADEVVQQTWLRVCARRVPPVEQPRAWLGRIVRNVTRNVLRRERRQRDREQRGARLGAAPSALEVVQREERRRELLALVGGLPAAQREVMLLRYYEGLPPREIATRLDLPAEAVWTLHRRALERLRRALDAAAARSGCDGRGAWLVPLAGAPLAQPFPAVSLTALAGLATMTIKTKSVVAAAAVVAVALFCWWPRDPGVTPVPGPGSAPGAAGPVQVALDDAAGRGAPTPGGVRDHLAARSAPRAPTGDLVVRVFYGDDPRDAAAGVTVNLRRAGGDLRLVSRQRTDGDGRAEFAGLPPGRVSVWGDRGDPGRRADVVAGARTELELILPAGITVRGVVLDPDGRPVAGAAIEVALPGLVGRDIETLASSGADGRFEIRGAPHPCLVGARAAGFRASRLHSAWAEDGKADEVQLKLGRGGGSVEGVVVDPRGAPVAEALVCVGSGSVQGLGYGLDKELPPCAALLRTDASGCFRAVGVEVGASVPVWVRARDLAPWRGSCTVVPHGATPLRVALQPGGVVRGTVRTAGGAPLPRVELRHGAWGSADHVLSHSGDEGRYELRGLPVGEVTIHATHEREGAITRTVHLAAGEAAELDLQLSRGLELRGRVHDDAGAPLRGVGVTVSADGTARAEPWRRYVPTGDDGTFSVPNCPEARLLVVEFRHSTLEPRDLVDVDPRGGELDVQLRPLSRAAGITGRVLETDGRPARGVSVNLQVEGHDRYIAPVETGADGTFAFDDVPAGMCRLALRRSDAPAKRLGPRDVGPGGRWDAGTVRLDVGGVAVIRSTTAPVEDLRFMLADPRSSSRWVLRPGPRPRTPVLNPGRYDLMVWGRRAAAERVAVTIVAGGETEVRVQPRVGVRQRFEFVLDEGRRTHGGTLRVYRGAEVLVEQWLAAKPGGAWTDEVWLSPGEYRVAMTGPVRGEVRVRVGAEEGPPTPIRLR